MKASASDILITVVAIGLCFLPLGCSRKQEVAKETGSSVRASVVAEPRGSEWFETFLMVEEVENERVILRVLVDGGDDSPIPVGFVGLRLSEPENRVDVITSPGPGKYRVHRFHYRGTQRRLADAEAVSDVVELQTQSIPEEYKKPIEGYEKRLAEWRLRAFGR